MHHGPAQVQSRGDTGSRLANPTTLEAHALYTGAWAFGVQPTNNTMNPITLPIAELKPALAGLGKVINPRSTLPVLHHVKVERTAEGWIALTGTDLDRFVTMRLELSLIHI